MNKVWFVILLCPLTAAANAGSYTMNGDGFVKMMRHPDQMPMPPHYYIEREKAYSYLDGARDSAEGRLWCDVNVLKTPDLAYEIAASIAQLPAAERKENASKLILRQLQQLYPCQKGEPRHETRVLRLAEPQP